MVLNVTVDNIKGEGCALSIERALAAIAGVVAVNVVAVNVDIAKGAVRIAGEGGACDLAVRRLATLGYPEAGTRSGLDSAVASARSLVNCAAGTMSNLG